MGPHDLPITCPALKSSLPPRHRAGNEDFQKNILIDAIYPIRGDLGFQPSVWTERGSIFETTPAKHCSGKQITEGAWGQEYTEGTGQSDLPYTGTQGSN